MYLSAFTITDAGKKSPFATAFLEHILGEKLNGVKVYGSVDAGNRVARNMYRKFGFVEREGDFPDEPDVLTVVREPVAGVADSTAA